MRGITPQRPLAKASQNQPLEPQWPDFGRPLTCNCLRAPRRHPPSTMKPMLDARAKTLLKALVERYIADGQPVGSRTLSRASGLELSPATIRNVMSDLEDLGLIVSPHTSAGRIPTARGYRLFVDTMLTAQPLTGVSGTTPHLPPDQPQ